jgi:hypothetical protein
MGAGLHIDSSLAEKPQELHPEPDIPLAAKKALPFSAIQSRHPLKKLRHLYHVYLLRSSKKTSPHGGQTYTFDGMKLFQSHSVF